MTTRDSTVTETAPLGLHDLLAFAIPFILFFNTVGFGHLLWDDASHIFDNHRFELSPLASIPSFFADSHERPFALVFTVWSLIASVFGHQNDWPFHFFNVVLHSLNALLLYRITRVAFANKNICLQSALFFAVHPLVAEPVGWISGMKDLLSTFFALSAMLCYLLWTQKETASSSTKPGRRSRTETTEGSANRTRKSSLPYGLLSATLYFASLLSKPTTILLPLASLLIAKQFLKTASKRLLLSTLAVQICALPFAIFAVRSQPNARLDYVTPVILRPLVALDSFAFYILQLVAPIRICPDYSRSPQSIFESGWGYVSWILPLILLAALYVLYRRAKSAALWGVLCSLTLLLPVSGVVPFDFQDFSTVADRYMYLPFVGICFAVASLMEKVNRRRDCIAIAVICILAIRSSVAASNWRSDEAFFHNAIRCNPNSAGMHMHMGLYHVSKGRYGEAFREYRKALEIEPKYQEAHLNMGAAFGNTGQLDSALSHYNEALRISPTAELYNNIGTIYAQKGDMDAAIRSFEIAVASSPGFVEALCNLGYAFYLSGNKLAAKQYLEQALQYRPGFAEAVKRLELLNSD